MPALTTVRATPAVVTTVRAGRRPSRSRGRRVYYVLPLVVFLVLMAGYPLEQLVRMSFSNVTITTLQHAWSFVGLANYRGAFASPVFSQALVHTVIFVALVFSVGMLGGLSAALVLRGGGRFAGFLLGLMVFVWSVPPVVNGSIWRFLMDQYGLLNIISRGIGTGTVPFLYSPRASVYSVALVNAWASVPFTTLVFRAALLGVDADLIEAGRVDGVRRWQEIRFILIPAVRSTAFVLGVLELVYAFRSFDFIYVMTDGGPGTSTNTLPFLGYSEAFTQYQYGLGSAISVIAGLIILVIAVVYSRSVFAEERAG
ncbi:MAG TPA: sugar ABC transporter permease [Acidimicrobiales bacterium]|nr:sugar ABC transporter permease [Acidimicrobiales bacterium]